jgi:hypothetical protein
VKKRHYPDSACKLLISVFDPEKRNEFSPSLHFSAFSLFKLLALFSQRVEIALSKLKKLFKTAATSV